MPLDTVKSQLDQAQALIALALNEVGVLMAPVASVTRVPKGGNLNAAIGAAKPGDTILVYPGKTNPYSDVILTAKGPGAPITIAPDTAALVAGVRVDPSFEEGLIHVNSPGGYSPLRTQGPSSNYVLRGFAPMFSGDGTPARIALGDDKGTDILNLPDSVILDQCLLVGDPMKGGKRGIAANCRGLSVLNSHVADFFWFGQDSQAICGWNGPGPFAYINNYMSASGENIIFGGADPMNATMIPQNIIVRGNYITKPLAWRTMTPKVPLVKNVFELKNAINVLVENNVIEHAWTGGQVGFIVVLTPRNQDGSAPYSVVTNVMFQYNVIREGGGGINMLGADDKFPSQRMSKVKFLHNLVYGIDPKALPGTGKMIQILDGPVDVEFGYNTMVGSNLNSFLTLDGPTKCDGLNMHHNVFSEGSYGMIGANTGVGKPSWDAFVAAGAFENNLIGQGTSGRKIPYPGTTNTKTAPGESPVNADFTLADTYKALGVGADVAELRARFAF